MLTKPQSNADPDVMRQIRRICASLYAARGRAGLTRDEVAAKLGCSPRTLRDWEQGYDVPSINYLLAWLHLFRLCLVLIQQDDGKELPTCPAQGGESWEQHQLRSLITNLRAIRKQRGLSHTGLGLLLGGVSRSSVQRWEAFEQPPQVAHLFGYAFGCQCRIALRRNVADKPPVAAAHSHPRSPAQ